MKGFWRIGKILLTVGMIFVFLVGCGKSPSSTDNSTGATEEKETIKYPTKDVTLLVGSRQGGGYDTWARGIAPYIQKHLPGNFNVIVQNEGAANGRIAANMLHNAAPDGHHFNIVNTGLASTENDPGTEYSMTEWTWLGGLTDEYQVMVASNKSGIKTIEDVIARSGDFVFSSAGWSGTSDTSFLILADYLGIEFKHIYHDGTSQKTLSLVRGDSDLSLNSADSIIDYINRGDVVPIVYFGETRHPGLPDLPTIAEVGYPELEGLGGNRLLAGPPGMPDEIKEILAKAIKDAAHDPDFLKWAAEEGREITYSDPEGAERAVNRHIQRFKEHADIIAEFTN